MNQSMNEWIQGRVFCFDFVKDIDIRGMPSAQSFLSIGLIHKLRHCLTQCVLYSTHVPLDHAVNVISLRQCNWVINMI